MKQLTGFSIRLEDDRYILRLEDDGGGATELGASPEQVDAIVDTLDDVLSEHEEDAFDDEHD